MGNRVYILLDITDRKAEQVAKVLRESPGVVVVDVLVGLPNVIMIIDADGRQQLAMLTNQALASVETMTEHICLLPAGDGLRPTGRCDKEGGSKWLCRRSTVD